MNKGLKIFLVIFVLVLIGGGAFGGTLLFSYKNVSYSVEDTIVTINIENLIIDFSGFIVTRTPVEISNGGLYEFQNIVVTVKVYGTDFLISSLNGLLLSQGENPIGNVKPGENWSGYIETNITTQIAILAIQDGTLEIVIDVSLDINFYLFRYGLTYNATQLVPWDSPFGI